MSGYAVQRMRGRGRAGGSLVDGARAGAEEVGGAAAGGDGEAG